jgi:hypothetical protein
MPNDKVVQSEKAETKVCYLWVKGPKASILEVGDHSIPEESPAQTVEKTLHTLGCF